MVATLNITRTGGCFGHAASDINAIWASHILDAHRHRDPLQAILARHDSTEEGPEDLYFGDDDALSRLGINLTTLATCLDAGSITAARVEELLCKVTEGTMSAEEFDDEVSLTLIPTNTGLSQDDRLTAAAHMPDVLEAARFHPDDMLDRALHNAGLCSCEVEWVR